jgi:hypothetical protein
VSCKPRRRPWAKRTFTSRTAAERYRRQHREVGREVTLVETAGQVTALVWPSPEDTADLYRME